MWNIIRSTLILAIVTFIASFVLSHIDKITKPRIEKQNRQKQKKALNIVLPGYIIDIDKVKRIIIDGCEFVYWIGEKEEGRNILYGYAFITDKSGYGGPIKTMVGVDDKGNILGISILMHSETPGLGARVTEVASPITFFEYILGRSSSDNGDAPPWFQEQFVGLNTREKIAILKKGDFRVEMRDELLEKNAISAITGATITSKAVRDSIEIGIQRLKIARQMEN